VNRYDVKVPASFWKTLVVLKPKYSHAEYVEVVNAVKGCIDELGRTGTTTFSSTRPILTVSTVRPIPTTTMSWSCILSARETAESAWSACSTTRISRIHSRIPMGAHGKPLTNRQLLSKREGPRSCERGPLAL
jgi:hypothetical protein